MQGRPLMNDAINAAIKATARAIARVQLNGGDPDQPAARWNGVEMELQEFPVWRDYIDEAYAAITAKPAVLPTVDALSTPNAPVEQREAIGLALRRFHQNSCYPQASDGEIDIAIDAILAVRLDEAAIRKDEREKQREIDAEIAEHDDRQGEWPKSVDVSKTSPTRLMQTAIASAIRNGGKQP